MEGFCGVEGGTESAYDGRRGSEITVNVEQLFGLGVVGLQVGVADGPCGGDSTFVVDDAKIFRAHTEHGCAIDLCLAAYEVGLLRMKFFAVFVLPDFFGVIAVIEKDSGGVPVEFFLGHERTAFKDEDVLAGLGEVKGERSAACAGAYYDDVVRNGHDGRMQGAHVRLIGRDCLRVTQPSTIIVPEGSDEIMTDTEMNVHRLDAAYKPFPTFEEWASKISVDTVRWDRYNASVRERSQGHPEALARARQIATRAAAIDTGAIENLYEADRGFTYTVAFQTAAWESEIAARGEQVRPLFEAQLQGYEFVLSLATGAEPISEAAIRELHVQMCAAQDTYRVMTAVGPQEQPLPKGQYKSLPNHVKTRTGESHSYAPVDVTPEEVYRLISEVRSELFLAAHPIIQASYAHYCFVVIHPFADGNGRVARALASAFTYRAISMPILILAEQKASYLDALEAADFGSYQSFVRFMTARSLDTIELVDESLKVEWPADPSAALESFADVYQTRGGYTQDEVDITGIRLSEQVVSELKSRVPKNLASKLSMTINPINGGLPPSSSLRATVSGKGNFMVRLSSAPPAATDKDSQFLLWVPKNADQNDDVQIRQLNGDAIFTARMDEITPTITGVTKIRLTMFVDRVFVGMLTELKALAEQRLKLNKDN
jgi:Fic family protein